jgi:hypothetical protein
VHRVVQENGAPALLHPLFVVPVLVLAAVLMRHERRRPTVNQDAVGDVHDSPACPTKP